VALRSSSFCRSTLCLAACFSLLFVLGACSSDKQGHCRRQACIGDIWLAQSDGLIKAGEGETLNVTRGVAVESLPDSQNVRLAIARDVLWSQVRSLRKEIIAAGKTPFLMVASDLKTGALELYEELQGEEFIDVFVSVGGKLCVSPPNTPEAKCVKSGMGIHVDRAHTRELVREAVKAWGLHDVLVDVPPDLEWADVARAVDGARTCCRLDDSLKDTAIRVRLK
jgi:hypothetical protein